MVPSLIHYGSLSDQHQVARPRLHSSPVDSDQNSGTDPQPRVIDCHCCPLLLDQVMADGPQPHDLALLQFQIRLTQPSLLAKLTPDRDCQLFVASLMLASTPSPTSIEPPTSNSTSPTESPTAIVEFPTVAIATIYSLLDLTWHPMLDLNLSFTATLPRRSTLPLLIGARPADLVTTSTAATFLPFSRPQLPTILHLNSTRAIHSNLLLTLLGHSRRRTPHQRCLTLRLLRHRPFTAGYFLSNRVYVGRATSHIQITLPSMPTKCLTKCPKGHGNGYDGTDRLDGVPCWIQDGLTATVTAITAMSNDRVAGRDNDNDVVRDGTKMAGRCDRASSRTVGRG